MKKTEKHLPLIDARQQAETAFINSRIAAIQLMYPLIYSDVAKQSTYGQKTSNLKGFSVEDISLAKKYSETDLPLDEVAHRTIVEEINQEQLTRGIQASEQSLNEKSEKHTSYKNEEIPEAIQIKCNANDWQGVNCLLAQCLFVAERMEVLTQESFDSLVDTTIKLAESLKVNYGYLDRLFRIAIKLWPDDRHFLIELNNLQTKLARYKESNHTEISMGEDPELGNLERHRNACKSAKSIPNWEGYIINALALSKIIHIEANNLYRQAIVEQENCKRVCDENPNWSFAQLSQQPSFQRLRTTLKEAQNKLIQAINYYMNARVASKQYPHEISEKQKIAIQETGMLFEYEIIIRGLQSDGHGLQSDGLISLALFQTKDDAYAITRHLSSLIAWQQRLALNNTSWVETFNVRLLQSVYQDINFTESEIANTIKLQLLAYLNHPENQPANDLTTPEANIQRLNEARIALKTCLDNNTADRPDGRDAIQIGLLQFNGDIKKFFESLWIYATDLLGKPPCAYTVMGLGSLGRETMCSYSDLEFAILIDVKNNRGYGNVANALLYFSTVMRLMSYYVALLGETPLQDDELGLTTPGLHLDEGGHIPFNKECMIGDLNTLLKGCQETRDLQACAALWDTTYLYGDEALYKDYQVARQALSQPPQKVSQPIPAQTIAQTLFEKDFLPAAAPIIQNDGNYDIKKTILRPIEFFCSQMSIYHGVASTSVWEHLDSLQKHHGLPEPIAHLLQWGLTMAWHQRAQLHLSTEQGNDCLAVPSLDASTPALTQARILYILLQAMVQVLFQKKDALYAAMKNNSPQPLQCFNTEQWTNHLLTILHEQQCNDLLLAHFTFLPENRLFWLAWARKSIRNPASLPYQPFDDRMHSHTPLVVEIIQAALECNTMQFDTKINMRAQRYRFETRWQADLSHFFLKRLALHLNHSSKQAHDIALSWCAPLLQSLPEGMREAFLNFWERIDVKQFNNSHYEFTEQQKTNLLDLKKLGLLNTLANITCPDGWSGMMYLKQKTWRKAVESLFLLEHPPITLNTLENTIQHDIVIGCRNPQALWGECGDTPLDDNHLACGLFVLKKDVQTALHIAETAAIEELNKPGQSDKRHVVLFFQYTDPNAQQTYHFCLKIFPENPGMEYAINQLQYLLGGDEIPDVYLWRIYSKSYPEGIAALLMEDVRGFTNTQDVRNTIYLLQEAFFHNPAALAMISPESFSRHLLRVFLSTPEDDKPNDYFLVPRNAGYALHRVDNERSFYLGEVFKAGTTSANRQQLATRALQTKTVIYCMEDMAQPLASSVIERFLHELNLTELINRWFQGLVHWNQDARVVFAATPTMSKDIEKELSIESRKITAIHPEIGLSLWHFEKNRYMRGVFNSMLCNPLHRREQDNFCLTVMPLPRDRAYDFEDCWQSIYHILSEAKAKNQLHRLTGLKLLEKVRPSYYSYYHKTLLLNGGKIAEILNADPRLLFWRFAKITHSYYQQPELQSWSGWVFSSISAYFQIPLHRMDVKSFQQWLSDIDKKDKSTATTFMQRITAGASLSIQRTLLSNAQGKQYTSQDYASVVLNKAGAETPETVIQAFAAGKGSGIATYLSREYLLQTLSTENPSDTQLNHAYAMFNNLPLLQQQKIVKFFLGSKESNQVEQALSHQTQKQVVQLLLNWHSPTSKNAVRLDTLNIEALPNLTETDLLALIGHFQQELMRIRIVSWSINIKGVLEKCPKLILLEIFSPNTSLRNNPLINDLLEINAILPSLQCFTLSQQVNVTRINLSTPKLQELILRENPTLTACDLQTTQDLKKIRIIQCPQLTDESILNIVTKQSSLIHLGLSSQPLNQQTLLNLLEFIKTHHTLKKVCLGIQAIDDQRIIDLLAQILVENTILTQFNMNNKDCLSLCIPFRKHFNETYINLSHQYLNDIEYLVIAALLPQNTTSKILTLSGNRLNVYNLSVLCHGLEKNICLEIFDVRDCDVDDEAAKFLFTLLQKNTTLQLINLDGNPCRENIKHEIITLCLERCKKSNNRSWLQQYLNALQLDGSDTVDFTGEEPYALLPWQKITNTFYWCFSLKIIKWLRFDLSNDGKIDAPPTARDSFYEKLVPSSRARSSISKSIPCLATLNGHSNSINTLTQLHNGTLVSGSFDNSIKLWDVHNLSCLATLTGHSDWVCTLTQLHDGRLVSGSFDNSIKLWDIHNLSCLETLTGHSSYVQTLTQLHDGRLVSGSFDNSIKLWDAHNFSCLATLNRHSIFVNTLTQLHDGRLASGSLDNSIKLWDAHNFSCIATLNGHSSSVFTLTQLHDGTLVSGSIDKSIKLWDVNKLSCLATLSGHSSSVFTLTQLHDGRLVSGSWDNSIKLWNTNNLSCLATLNGHSSSVRTLTQLHDGRLVSGSSDNSIKLWDVAPNLICAFNVSFRAKLPALFSLCKNLSSISVSLLRETLVSDNTLHSLQALHAFVQGLLYNCYARNKAFFSVKITLDEKQFSLSIVCPHETLALQLYVCLKAFFYPSSLIPFLELCNLTNPQQQSNPQDNTPENPASNRQQSSPRNRYSFHAPIQNAPSTSSQQVPGSSSLTYN